MYLNVFNVESTKGREVASQLGCVCRMAAHEGHRSGFCDTIGVGTDEAPHFSKASQCRSPAAAISNLEKSRPNFHSWQTRMHTSHAYQYTHTARSPARRWRPGWSAC